MTDEHGWVCHLCGLELLDPQPIDPRLHATVDHVVPRAKARGLHHNLRPAHFICNQRKADGERGPFPRKEMRNTVTLLLIAERMR